MKQILGLLFSAALLGNPLSDSSNNSSSAEDYEKLLPQTLVIKDGEILGSIDQIVENEEEAEEVINSGVLPKEVKKIDEEKISHLRDSSNDSHYYNYTYGAFYNPVAAAYGYHFGNNYYRYNPYFNWQQYAFYRYANNFYYRPYVVAPGYPAVYPPAVYPLPVYPTPYYPPYYVYYRW